MDVAHPTRGRSVLVFSIAIAFGLGGMVALAYMLHYRSPFQALPAPSDGARGGSHNSPDDGLLIARDHLKQGGSRHIRFHPKGEVIVVGSEGMAEIRGGSSLRFLFPLCEEDVRPRALNSMDFSPDGAQLAVDCEIDPERPHRRGIALWDWKARRLIAKFGEHEERIQSVRYSRDGRWIATASWDSTVKVWDVQERRLVKSLEGFTNVVRNAEFSPDGKLVAAICSQDGIKVWRTDSWLEIKRFTADRNPGILAGLVFAPDGRTLFSTCNRIIGWDTKDWTIKYEFNPPDRNEADDGYQGYAMAISPNGDILAVGTSDGMVRFVRLESKREVSVRVFPIGPVADISGLDFSADGKRLAVAGDHGCAIIDVVKAKP